MARQAILEGNWRGQLTTMPREAGRGNEEGGKVHSTLVHFVSPRSAEPVVILHRDKDTQQMQARTQPPGRLTRQWALVI